MNKKTRLILTGGTLSASFNEEGLLVPSSESLDALAKKVGFEDPVKPLTIDSIDFNISKHYAPIRDAVMKSLDAGENPVISGGTDSLTWYSTLLTKDLMRRGYLQPDSDQKIVFISAMKSIDEAPELIENILRAGKLTAEQNLSGGFALSAKDFGGKHFAVHDVCNHFDKVSSKLVDALRSDMPAAYIANGKYNPSESYQKPDTLPPTDERGFAHIAPPLLKGHKSDMVLAYLKMIGETMPPFDGVVIEGIPGIDTKLNRNDQQRIVSIVNKLQERGTQVVFCNPVHYNPDKYTMRPLIDEERWKTARLKEELEVTGAQFVTKHPRNAYLDMLLSAPKQHPIEPMSPDGLSKSHNQKVLGLRYVPDINLMEETLRKLGPKTKNIILCALPGSVMPDAMIPLLKEHQSNTRFFSMFQYNGVEHVDATGETIVEAPYNGYQAGQNAGHLVTPIAGSGNPVMDVFKGTIKPSTAMTR
ncbi:MAG: hypothetical protein ACN2B6_07075 [Rickettsiales bacterium]